jgi:glycerol-3-phosphate dehydrogenase
VHLYGNQVHSLLDRLPGIHGEFIRGRILMAELEHSLAHEWAMKPEDFWVRRSAAAYFEPALVQAYGEAVLARMAAFFGWNTEQIQANRYILPAIAAVKAPAPEATVPVEALFSAAEAAEISSPTPLPGVSES